MAGPGNVPLGSTASADVLQRIEQNTAQTLRWVKILVAAILVLIVVTAVLFV